MTCYIQPNGRVAGRSRGYSDGYKAGILWEHEYRPGGPYHFDANNGEPARYRALALLSRVRWQNWMRGFDDGLAAQRKTFYK